MMSRRANNLPAFFLVAVALGAFGFLLWSNAQPAPLLRAIVPTEVVPTENVNAWQNVLRAGFGSNSTPLPTIAPPPTQAAPPTLARSGEINLSPVAPVEVAGLQPTLNAIVTATPPPPSAEPLETGIAVTAQVVTRPPAEWQPPPLIPPISRDALGRDHYWFMRPVDSNATNYALFSYTYGSDGPQQENPWRVHHGIDMPNPIGQTVRAAGSGTIVWAADGLRIEGGAFQNSPSYGNVIVIRHDFGYRGQPLFTLYAHLSAVLVAPGQVVNAGDAIGLVGDTGRVSGPHVHFEVRLGKAGDGPNTIPLYGATLNPLLWMVPYVGQGVIAGRVTGLRGQLLDDQTITVRDWRTGLVVDSTTSYVYYDSVNDVNADPIWRENFVVADVPAGRYEVITNIDGQRVSQLVDVAEGTTSFVELAPPDPQAQPSATPDA
ncbi:MAG: M23 family metallopeptidase [Anaerolineaceae bacterium]|nr:M23 family metallopeptidase [Anaerolineaceae bacterium]